MNIIFVSDETKTHTDGVEYYRDLSSNYVYSHAPGGHPDSVFVGKAHIKRSPDASWMGYYYYLNSGVDLKSISNTQQRLDNQQNITDKASLLAADLEVRRDEARISLEKAEKTYPWRGCVFQMKQDTYDDLVKNEKEAKVKKNEMVKVLAGIQRDFDKLSLDMWMREEIANRTKIIEETYEAQLADIAADELALGHM